MASLMLDCRLPILRAAAENEPWVAASTNMNRFSSEWRMSAWLLYLGLSDGYCFDSAWVMGGADGARRLAYPHDFAGRDDLEHFSIRCSLVPRSIGC